MFQRSAAIVLLASLAGLGLISSVAAVAKESDAAAISGIASAADQRPLIDYLVRLRSLDTGRVVARARTSTTGGYAFRSVNSGRYAVEIVDATDKIVGTAGPFATSGTSGRPRAMSVTLLGAAAAAIAATSKTGSSIKGSAADVAAAAANAGISGLKVTKRTLPSEPG